ncbi:MAG: radical SAM protein, partial [Deltaproteobacteria bacterium]|nr:radical SAM protein [Deltaproteobacteria bacterium]
WTDSLRRSILLDSKADLWVFGMGETALASIARVAEDAVCDAGAEGKSVRALLAERSRSIPGLAYAISSRDSERLLPADAAFLPSHERIAADPFLLVTATVAMERQVHQARVPAAQASGDRTVVMNPPSPPLATDAMDALYALPYTRLPHPSYEEPIPAWEMIRASITSHRGCGGGCAFCSLALHQTRRIASRGRRSILDEARRIAATRVRGKVPAWAGSISDVGGPSANMWQAACTGDAAGCERASCLFPGICPFFSVDQAKGAAMLREVSRQEGVRHVRVASGVRFDLALKDDEALKAYTREFTGGQLKIAPEHIAEDVLRLMRKPALPVFEAFLRRFERLSDAAGKEQYVVPYLMSAYPGCTDADMRELAVWLKKRNWSPRQVQCFIPTPGTVATAMYYAGKDTKGACIPVARTDAERMRQHYILLGRERDREGGRTDGTPAKPHEKRTPSRHGDRVGKFGDSRRKGKA